VVIAEQAVKLGFLIGVSGPVTFRNAEIRNVVAALSLDNILIETDAPFLTPHPHRGQRNEPAYVRFIAEEIAKIRQIPFETVAEQTSKNAQRLFLW
jgi:TatD DNase family protein